MPKKTKTDTQEKPVEQADIFSTQSERDQLYEQYEEKGRDEDTTDTAAEQAVTADDATETEVETEEKVETDAAEQEVKETAPDTSEVEDKLEKQDTVPYGALKEERELRKTANARVSELEGQLHQVLQDVKTLHEENARLKDTSGDDEFESEGDSKLRKELNELKLWKQSLENDKKKETQKAEIDKAVQMWTELDKELASEGFPGAYMVRGAIQEEMFKQHKAGKPIQDVNTEANAKKIYKEIIFPKISSQFVEFDKAKTLAEKTQLKTKANLSDSPGSKAKPASESDADWTYKDYRKMRATNPQGFAP